MSELARRAVECARWRWMPGMLVRYGDGQAWYRLTDGDGYGMPFKHVPPNPRDAWPDLSDAATLGCLLALVGEAWSCSTHARMMGDGIWGVYIEGCRRPIAVAGTEAAALVIALETAP
jgi:hypothetical protein